MKKFGAFNYQLYEFSVHLTTLDSFLREALPKENDIIKKDFKSEYEEILQKSAEILYQGERKIIAKTESYVIRKAIFHPRKERALGVDVGIEFEGDKVILWQVKRESGGRFRVPRGQLLRALNLCRELCSFRCCPCPILLPIFSEYPCRGSVFYKFVRSRTNLTGELLKVCEVAFILGQRSSAKAEEFVGIPESDFSRMLWECKVGCEDLPKRKKDRAFLKYSLLTNRIVILYELAVPRK